MISIVIPAYNEEKVIDRCLSALKNAVEPSLFDIIVVCNGCVDKTTAIATQTMPEARIIELERASKTKAINIGLENCKFSDVVLLDADIIFTAIQLTELVRFADQQNYLLVSPAVDIDLQHCSSLNRAYYKITSQLPYMNQLKISHVIYLTKQGLGRLGKLPDLIADDHYIRAQFMEHEQAIAHNLSYQLTAPADYGSLLKILTRSHLGNLQLYQKFPQYQTETSSGHTQALLTLVLQPRLIPSIIVFIITKLIVRCRARLQLKNLGQYQWEKDDSSRSF